MPSFNNHNLLKSLERDVQNMLKEVKQLQALSDETLNRLPHAGKWSIAQIIEHLNSYNRYYLPAMEKVIKKALEPQPKPTGKPGFLGKLFKSEPKPVKHNHHFTSGLFGNYFTNMMLPKPDGKMKKMPAPKDHTPGRIVDAHKVLNEFIEGQTKMMELLEMAVNTDMNKLKVSITISTWIKLKLGDTFRFLIAHQQRHFVQLHTALKQVKATETLMRLVA